MNKYISSIQKNQCLIFVVGFCLLLVTLLTMIWRTETHANKLTDDTLIYVKASKNRGHIVDSIIHELNLNAQIQLESLPPQKKDSLYIRLMTDLNANNNSNLTNILADMRQEYNNQVTLLNNWVAIWVAILGALGILWPLIAGYIFKQDTDKLLQKIKDDIALSECTVHISTALSCVKNMKEYRSGSFYLPSGQKQLLPVFKLINQSTEKLIDMIRNREQREIPKEIIHLYILQYKSLLSELSLLYTTNYIWSATINIENLRDLLNQISSQLDRNDDKNKLADNIQKISNYWKRITVILETQIEGEL